MIGAVIGDIAGSRFEFHNRKTKDFEIFHQDSRFTDDTVMTLAVAAALLEARDTGLLRGTGVPAAGQASGGSDTAAAGQASLGGDTAAAGTGAAGAADSKLTLEDLFVRHMQDLGRAYPKAGYGRKFNAWIHSPDPKPYHSWGNGSAMRVSPCGEIARSIGEAASLARKSAAVTHDHPDGIRGAEAVATAIFLARNGPSKEDVRDHVDRYYYPLDFTIEQIRPGYKFDVSCKGSVPQAIQAFLESKSLEDTIRTAVSLGGDSDTIAAIAGSIAEGYYGLDSDLLQCALEYLPKDLVKIVWQWYDGRL